MFKVISGGQTGVDRAALDRALHWELETGGWMPKNWLAQDGLHPEFQRLYGMQESSSVGYATRTKLNIFHSDATVRYATNWDSAGERLTLQSIRKFQKPRFDIYNEDDVVKCVEWIKLHSFKVINFAGNSENTSPGIYRKACQIFDFIFCRFGTCPFCRNTKILYGERSHGLSIECEFCLQSDKFAFTELEFNESNDG